MREFLWNSLESKLDEFKQLPTPPEQIEQFRQYEEVINKVNVRNLPEGISVKKIKKVRRNETEENVVIEDGDVSDFEEMLARRKRKREFEQAEDEALERYRNKKRSEARSSTD